MQLSLSIIRALPNIELIAPGDDYETIEATKYVASSNKPSYLSFERSSHIHELNLDTDFEYGKIRKINDGKDIAILCSGGVTKVAMNAANILKKQKISLGVYSVHSLKSIDLKSISEIRKYSGVITIEENNLMGGLGSAISEICVDNKIYPKSFKRMGLKYLFISCCSQEFLRDFYNLGEKI